MQQYLTPHKHQLPALAPSGQPGAYDEQSVDCPFVFWHEGQYHMLHLGFDGKGYQTGLSSSPDPLHFPTGRVLFPRNEITTQGWEKTGIAGYWILKEHDLHAVPALK